VSLFVAADGGISLRCVLPPPPPPPDPVPVCVEPLPQTPATVAAGIDFLTASREVDIPANCEGNPAIGCPNGTPSSQAPRLAITRHAYSVTPNPDGTYAASATLSVASTDIPFTFDTGLGNANCTLRINSALGASPHVALTTRVRFDSTEPGGASDRLTAGDVDVQGLTVEDFEIGGHFACVVANFGVGFVVTTFTSIFEDTLADIAQTGWCGACGDALFGPCPPPPDPGSCAAPLHPFPNQGEAINSALRFLTRARTPLIPQFEIGNVGGFGTGARFRQSGQGLAMEQSVALTVSEIDENLGRFAAQFQVNVSALLDVDLTIAGIADACQLTVAGPIDVGLGVIDTTHPVGQRVAVENVNIDTSRLQLSGCALLSNVPGAFAEVHDKLIGIAASALTAPACRTCGDEFFGVCPQ
jgi:hypothetical protein